MSTRDGKVYLSINRPMTAQPEGLINMSKTITPTEFAAEVNSDGRTVRKFLRSITPTENHPGKGSRWELAGTAREVTKMKKQFNEWSAKQDDEKAARAAKAEAEATTDEVEEIEDADLDD